MESKIKKIIVCLLATVGLITNSSAQKKIPGITLWDGMAVAGYVDKGAFINFGGPSIKLIEKLWDCRIGILPTLRIKKDNVPKGAIHNSILTPTAGFGLTMTYKHFVVQVPFYYNSKTTTTNGQWNAGLGVGYKFY